MLCQGAQEVPPAVSASENQSSIRVAWSPPGSSTNLAGERWSREKPPGQGPHQEGQTPPSPSVTLSVCVSPLGEDADSLLSALLPNSLLRLAAQSAGAMREAGRLWHPWVMGGQCHGHSRKLSLCLHMYPSATSNGEQEDVKVCVGSGLCVSVCVCVGAVTISQLEMTQTATS